MENALESLSKEDLIALIGQKDMLLKERNFTIQHKDSEIIEKRAEIDKLRRMLFGLGDPVISVSALKSHLYSYR